jgi:long-chain acyl-CoA synthetase
MVTASAPLSGEVLDFLRIAFCCDLREGYGMTETCGASCATYTADPTSGHVGGPLAQVKLRLRDIPEMNYLHTNDPPKGEVCFWGPSNMIGYFKNPEKTAESKSKDGWIFSGDVGRLNKDMSLSIVDRAKNIFKLSQGEYIAPEKLENIFVQSSYVQQCFVYGDSLRDYTIAFFCLDDAAFKWGKAKGLSKEQMCSSKEFR